MHGPLADIGTAGFSFPHWKGLLYPDNLPLSHWLAYYANHFPSVEINTSFYALPRPSMVRRWVLNTPSHFHFTMKSNREITHAMALRHCEYELQRQWEHF